MANPGKHIRSKEDSENYSSDSELEREANPNGIDKNISSDDGSEHSANCSDGSTHEESENESSASGRSSAYSTGSVSPPSDDDEPPAKMKETNPSRKANTTEQAHPENEKSEWMNKIENFLADLSKAITLSQPGTSQPAPVSPVADQSWNFSHEPSRAQGSYTTVRPEHINQFPSGIRPNKMWAEWYDFIENFEVAVSLHNANDPVYKVKLLYLSLGKELQSIVKAANLKPSLTDPHCYTAFVKNIENHLRSMTDTAAEHRAFLKMKQGRDESTVSFHARLMKNVKLCGYSSSDQSRFVRAQLMDGLRNKELVKAARTYNYDTNFIVQSSTRDEAYEAEIVEQALESNISQIGEGYGNNRKRNYDRQESGYPPAKYRRTSEFVQTPEHRPNQSRWGGSSNLQARVNQSNPRSNPRTQGRQTRCPRCNNVFHRNPQCPALSRTCDKCGKRGHFAVACRTGRRIQQIAKHSDVESSGEENPFNEKQVKQG